MVIINAGRKLNPFRISHAKTTALKLMALPTDRSMYPEIIKSVKAPLKVRIGTALRKRLIMLSGLRKWPLSKKATSSSFNRLKMVTISSNTM
jgi:hypothetical protein